MSRYPPPLRWMLLGLFYHESACKKLSATTTFIRLDGYAAGLCMDDGETENQERLQAREMGAMLPS